MFTVIVKAKSKASDMSWLKKCAEKMYFDVTLVEKDMVIRGRLHQTPDQYFMLCDILWHNGGLVSFLVDDETVERQRKLEESITS